MKIGVLSDTHIPVKFSQLPPSLLKALEGCGLILHAGDLTDPSVLEPLKKISKVEAVYGNMDSKETVSLLKDRRIFTVKGKRICLIHGYGRPDDLVGVLKEEFLKENPDIIVFGHSHMPMNEYIDGVLFFNPGSATDTIFAPYRSYGIIEIEGGKINATIHKLKG
ncbi:metallophosphoesterase family protein [Candidatus Omnitrophota bacterium]